MKSLTEWRDHSYFEQRPDHYFLVKIVHSLQVCKLSTFKSSYWFEYPGIHVKSITTPCVSLTDLQGTKVRYKDHPLVKGTLGGYGVKDTPFIYVYWDRVPMKDNLYNFCTVTHNAGKPLGFPCALPDNYFLELE